MVTQHCECTKSESLSLKKGYFLRYLNFTSIKTKTKTLQVHNLRAVLHQTNISEDLSVGQWYSSSREDQ